MRWTVRYDCASLRKGAKATPSAIRLSARPCMTVFHGIAGMNCVPLWPLPVAGAHARSTAYPYLRRLLEEHYGTYWKSAGMYAVRLGQGKRRKYLPGVFTETYSLLFPGYCGRPASVRHGTRSSLNHRISR